MSEEELTPDEQEELKRALGGSAPVAEEKPSVHLFLAKVLAAKDTTKVGNLNETEIGLMRNPVRSYKEGSIWALNIIKCPGAADMLNQYSEIATSTSLSRNGTLLKAAITTTRQIGDITKPAQQNKSWFKKKQPESPGGAL